MMLVLVYSLTPISNVIEQNIVWFQKVKYSPVQKGVFPTCVSPKSACSVHFVCIKNRNKNGCYPQSLNFEFLTVHLSWLMQC